MYRLALVKLQSYSLLLEIFDGDPHLALFIIYCCAPHFFNGICMEFWIFKFREFALFGHSLLFLPKTN